MAFYWINKSILSKRNIKEKHLLQDVTVSEMSKCEDMGKYILETEETCFSLHMRVDKRIPS